MTAPSSSIHASAPDGPHALPDFLSNTSLKLLIFGGKGGVGKTTSATATAFSIAQTRPNARVLLLSTDPAHSVADSVAGSRVPANLCVIELSAEAEHRAFMESNGSHLKAIAARGTFLDSQDIDTFVQLSIPGMDELMAFMRVARWVADDAFDLIIVDTAPSGHTLKLLAMSDLLDNWLDALDALLAKHHYMAQLFAGRRRGGTPDQADQFLETMREQIGDLTRMLRDSSRCRFVPVLLAEAMSVAETCDLLGRLSDMQVAAPELIVNRLIDGEAGPAFASQFAAQSQTLGSLPQTLSSRTLWGAPLDHAELTGSASLARFVDSLKPLKIWSRVAGNQPLSDGAHPRCLGAAKLPAGVSQTSLLFFAGKGGTGKTTISAASALTLAASGRRCLIVSTDPAHSLADCLQVPLGDELRRVAPNLDAVEIDAEAEFIALRDEYQDELAAVLDSMFESLDLSFDREAMEKLLDLAPPGLDECMALLRIVSQMDQKGPDGSPVYDTMVIDTAPTGHLLRLLELPELITSWLNSIFALFIKYDNIFRLPRLQARLIEISRGIKKLRAVLADESRCRVQVVSILTEMAFSEAGDLIAALGRMHIRVGDIFLNMALPASAGALADAVRARESSVRAKYAASLGNINQVVAYRMGDPRGVDALRQFGSHLYGVHDRTPASPSAPLRSAA